MTGARLAAESSISAAETSDLLLLFGDPCRLLVESAAKHADAALKHVASGDYAGEHWLASFAIHMLSVE